MTTTPVSELSVPAGTPVLISEAFTNLITGEPADPTTVVLALTLGGESLPLITSGIVHDGTGLFHYIYDTTARPGFYVCQWKGTGALLAASVPAAFTVTPLLPGL